MGPFLDLLPIAQFQISVMSWSGSNWVHWNSEGKKFVPTPKRTMKMIVLNTWIFIGVLLSIFRLYGILAEDSEEGGGILNNIPSVAVFHVITMWLLLEMRVAWKADAAACVLNTMISFEVKQGKGI